MSDSLSDTAKTFKKSSSGMSAISSSMSQLGIDSEIIQDMAAMVSAISGIGLAATGFKGIVDIYTELKAAEATANIAKFGVGAIVVAGIASAAGYALSEIITNSISKVSTGDYTSSEGIRQLASDVNG